MEKSNSFGSAWFLLAPQMTKTGVISDNSSAKAGQEGLEKKKSLLTSPLCIVLHEGQAQDLKSMTTPHKN